MRQSIFILAACALVSLGVATPARAQSTAQTPNPADPKRAMALERQNNSRPNTPSGLPGARPDRGKPVPAPDTLGQMSPNEALFDAVNRGDLAGARDALGRGADIEARNVLGLTALDLAVDLGRNELTFLLLSLREASPGVRTGKAVAATTTPPAAPSRAAKPAGPVAARTVAPTDAARTPVRYAADPGTPAPGAGFLGFGGQTQ